MSAKNQDITLAKLETIAEMTDNSEVRVLAETMVNYIKDHSNAHAKEVKEELGFRSRHKGSKPGAGV